MKKNNTALFILLLLIAFILISVPYAAFDPSESNQAKQVREFSYPICITLSTLIFLYLESKTRNLALRCFCYLGISLDIVTLFLTVQRWKAILPK